MQRFDTHYLVHIGVLVSVMQSIPEPTSPIICPRCVWLYAINLAILDDEIAKYISFSPSKNCVFVFITLPNLRKA